MPADLRELVSRYGRVRLERKDGQLRLTTGDRPLLEELARQRGVRDYLGARIDETSFAIDDAHRGVLKQALIAAGYPAEDLAGYTAGAALPLGLQIRDAIGLAVSGSRLPERGRRRLLRRRRRTRRLGSDRAPLRRRQDDRRPGRDGRAQVPRP